MRSEYTANRDLSTSKANAVSSRGAWHGSSKAQREARVNRQWRLLALAIGAAIAVAMFYGASA